MKITLVIYSLSCGGAERVMSIMANYWAKKGWQVTLLTFIDESQTSFYEIESSINYQPLNIAKNSTNLFDSIRNNCQRIFQLRKAISNSKPDVVISFMDQTNVQTLLATRGLGIPIIISERNVTLDSTLGKAWKQFRKWIYLLADSLVVQTKESLKYIPSQWKSRTQIIPNPVMFPPINMDSNHQLLNPCSLMAVGRLEYQKGFDLLLKAFAKLKDSNPQWTLTIFGEGSLRSELEKLRDELGLRESVFFPGKKKNIHQYMNQAEIFILSSRFEGFPNVLCEAMACGLAVIATSCPCGPQEIIQDKVSGILVPPENVTVLAEKIDSLIKDSVGRKKMAATGSQITEKFGLEVVMNLWEKLISEVSTK